MIRLGQVLVFAGILTMFVPLPHHLGVVVGLVVIGFGCAPIYPCVIHSTPAYFGEDKSQAIVGVQMACAYVAHCSCRHCSASSRNMRQSVSTRGICWCSWC